MEKYDFAKHQIYVLQFIAQPADALLNDPRWKIDDIPFEIVRMWETAFTKMELEGNFDLLDDLPNEIAQINKLFCNIGDGPSDNVWKNNTLEYDSRWGEARSLAGKLLDGNLISRLNPNPDHWFEILPEGLH